MSYRSVNTLAGPWLRVLLVALAVAAGERAWAGDGTPERFKTRPTQLIAGLADLRGLADAGASEAGPLPADVVALLQKAETGEQLDAAALVDAHLIASGVFAADRRAAYRAQIDRLIVAARAATKSSGTVDQRGDALLKFLHAQAMPKGYHEDQTRLSTLLDEGTYNCVSATVLYQIVGKRLNLDLRGLSIPGEIIPGHAMTFLLDGERRVDVETTNPDGFDFRAKVKKSGGFVIGVQRDPKDGHEVSEQALAALIAQNIASFSSKDKPLAAIQAALVGLALDAEESFKANNYAAAVNGWAMRLADGRKFEDSLRVLEFGLQLSAGQDTLANNYQVVAARYAAHEAEAGRDRQAIDVLRRTAKTTGVERGKDEESAVFIRLAAPLADGEKWDEALAVLDRGLEVVDAAPAVELRSWSVSLVRRWSEAERKRGNFDKALDVLRTARARQPEDKDLQNAVAYFAQESLPVVDQTAGAKAAAGLLSRLRKEFPDVDYLEQAGRVCAERRLEALISKQQYTEAITAVSTYQPLLERDADRDELGGGIYDKWAQHLLAAKEFEKSTALYREGRKAFPKSDRLGHNAIVAWDQWASQSIQAKDWSKAIEIYQKGLKEFPSDSHLKHNLEYCEQQAKK